MGSPGFLGPRSSLEEEALPRPHPSSLGTFSRGFGFSASPYLIPLTGHQTQMPVEVGESSRRYLRAYPHDPSSALSLGAFSQWLMESWVGPRAWRAGFPLWLSLCAYVALPQSFPFFGEARVSQPPKPGSQARGLRKETKYGTLDIRRRAQYEQNFPLPGLDGLEA